MIELSQHFPRGKKSVPVSLAKYKSQLSKLEYCLSPMWQPVDGVVNPASSLLQRLNRAALKYTSQPFSCTKNARIYLQITLPCTNKA
jgi:hypothetical protein